MQSSKYVKNKNFRNIINSLKICDQVIRTLFKLEIKFYNMSDCKEVGSYLERDNKKLNYDNRLELNNIIILFLKNLESANIYSILESDEKELFVNFLKKTRVLKNNIFHEETCKISDGDFKKIVYIFINAINLIINKYSKYNIIKEKYIDYLKTISE